MSPSFLCLKSLNRTVANDPQVEPVRKICRYIEAHLADSLTLEVLARRFGLSPYHLQRTLKRVMGISPRQYVEACRIQQIKAALKEGDEVAGALYDAGYNSSSRLYGKAAAQLGMTPRDYKRGGQDIRIFTQR